MSCKPLIPRSEKLKKLLSGDIGIAKSINPASEKDPPKTGLKSIEQTIISTMMESHKPVVEAGKILLTICAGAEDVVARTLSLPNPRWNPESFSSGKISSAQSINDTEEAFGLPKSDPVKEESQILPDAITVGVFDDKGDLIEPIPDFILNSGTWYDKFDTIRDPNQLYELRRKQIAESFDSALPKDEPIPSQLLEIRNSLIEYYTRQIATDEYNGRLGEESGYYLETKRLKDFILNQVSVRNKQRLGRFELPPDSDFFRFLPSTLTNGQSQLQMQEAFESDVEAIQETDPELAAKIIANNSYGNDTIRKITNRETPKKIKFVDDFNKFQYALNDDIKNKALKLIAALNNQYDVTKLEIELGIRQSGFFMNPIVKNFTDISPRSFFSNPSTSDNLLYGSKEFEYVNLVNGFIAYINKKFNTSLSEVYAKQFYDSKTIIDEDGNPQVIDVDADYKFNITPQVITFKINDKFTIPIGYTFLIQGALLKETEDTPVSQGGQKKTNQTPSKGPKVYGKRHIPTGIVVLLSKVLKDLIKGFIFVIKSISKLISDPVSFLWAILEKKLSEFVALFDNEKKKEKFKDEYDGMSGKTRKKFIEAGYAKVNLSFIRFGILIDFDGKPSILNAGAVDAIEKSGEYPVQAILQKIANFVTLPIQFIVKLFEKLIELLKKFFRPDTIPSGLNDVVSFKWVTDVISPQEILGYIGTKFGKIDELVDKATEALEDEENIINRTGSRIKNFQYNTESEYSKQLEAVRKKRKEIEAKIAEGGEEIKDSLISIFSKLSSPLDNKGNYKGPAIKTPLFPSRVTPRQGEMTRNNMKFQFNFVSKFLNGFISMPINILGMECIEPSIPKIPEV